MGLVSFFLSFLSIYWMGTLKYPHTCLKMVGGRRPWWYGPSQGLGAGLSLRAGGRGFSPATMSVAPGYFYWKIEEK